MKTWILLRFSQFPRPNHQIKNEGSVTIKIYMLKMDARTFANNYRVATLFIFLLFYEATWKADSMKGIKNKKREKWVRRKERERELIEIERKLRQSEPIWNKKRSETPFQYFFSRFDRPFPSREKGKSKQVR